MSFNKLLLDLVSQITDPIDIFFLRSCKELPQDIQLRLNDSNQPTTAKIQILVDFVCHEMDRGVTIHIEQLLAVLQLKSVTEEVSGIILQGKKRGSVVVCENN